MSKRLKHIKSVAQSSLDKFSTLANQASEIDENIENFIKGWDAFLNNEELFSRLSHITNIEGVLGFSRVFSSKNTSKKNLEIAYQRLAELDLAVHIIREYHLGKNKARDLEKIPELNKSVCDFRLIDKEIYFEAKYVRKITIKKVQQAANQAFGQIKETNMDVNKKGAWIWIFSFDVPENPREFQFEIEKIKFDSDFPISLNIQTYGSGLYGHGEMIF